MHSIQGQSEGQSNHIINNKGHFGSELVFAIVYVYGTCLTFMRMYPVSFTATSCTPTAPHLPLLLISPHKKPITFRAMKLIDT